MGRIGQVFRGAPASGVGDLVPIQLGGQMTSVSRAEFGVLNKMVDMGMVRKDVSDTSIGTGNFTQGVPAFWFARAVETGGGGDSLTSPYAKSVWVQRAIKTISGPVASVRVTFLDAAQGEASGVRKSLKSKVQSLKSPRKRIWSSAGVCKRIGGDGEKQEIDLPGVRAWLERPMRGLNYSDFVEASIGWMKMKECFWLLSDETLKPFPEMAKSYPPVIVARPQYMRAVIEDGELVGWVFTQPGGRQYHLVPDQVIQLRYWNPENDFRGLGEYESAHLAAESDYLAGKFSRNLMANNGDLGGVIIAKSGVPTDPQREQIIMDLRAKRAAQLRGELRYTFLTGDIDVKDPKITSVDAPFITQRLENRHEVAAAFGVPMSMFDVKAAYSIGSASDFFQLITTTCIPTGAKFCDALERLIERMTGERMEVGLEWDEHPVMQAVRRERIDTVDKLWSKGMPMSAINDYLQLDMEEFDGWDVGFVAINVTPVEQATKPPAEDPALSELPEGTPGTLGTPGTPGKPAQEPEEVAQMVKMLRAGVGKTQHSKLPSADSQSQQTKALKEKRMATWNSAMRARAGVTRAYQSKVSKVINDFRAIALKKLEQHGAAVQKTEVGGQKTEIGVVKELGVTKSLVNFIFNPAEFGKQLVLATNPVAHMAIEQATLGMLSEIGKADDPWRMPPPRVKELIQERTKSILGCGATVRGQINTALEEGYTQGETTEELMGRMRGVFNWLTKVEAKRIAVTETNVVFNTAGHEAAVGVGVTHHGWLTSGIGNSRPDHLEAEDSYQPGGNPGPIPIEELFYVGGEALMHPGDSSGSAGEVINCHCIETKHMLGEEE